MDTQIKTPLETVQSWYRDGDVSLLDDAISCQAIGYPVAKKTYSGKQAMLDDFFGEIKMQFSQWDIQVDRMIGAQNEVTVLGVYHAQVIGGTTENLRFVHVWTVENGKLVAVTSCTEALNIAPVPIAA